MNPKPQRNGREQFVNHLTLIDRIIASLGRKKRMRSDERDEFRSYALCRLVDQDYRIVRQFRGKSSAKTFFYKVVGRLYLDFRCSQWGKWRPSAKAKRMGSLAIRLEELTQKQGLTPHEAVRTLRCQSPELGETGNLEQVLQTLPPRRKRHFAGEDVLQHLPARTPRPEERLLHADRQRRRREVELVLRLCMRQLTVQDRRILRHRYRDRMTAPQIGAELNIPPRKVYKRLDRIARQLRRRLEASGIGHSHVRDLSGRPSGDLDLSWQVSTTADR